jgi:hypothetical protein
LKAQNWYKSYRKNGNEGLGYQYKKEEEAEEAKGRR